MTWSISGATRIVGVVGHPVRHSLSPLIHNAWIEAAGLDAVYLAFEPGKDRFRQFVEGLRGGVVLGLNVTIPFKEQALMIADEADAAAHRAGAANLLLFSDDGRIKADNTDGRGVLLALAVAGFPTDASEFRTAGRGGGPLRGHAVVLGAGGAAKSATMTLLDAGVTQVRLVNRTVERARAISALDSRITAHAWTELADVLEGAGALINATSLGMIGQPPLEIPLERAPTTAIVMDMVYRPLRTELLKAAQARGNPTADGLEMLVGQAVPTFASIFGEFPPDLDVRGLCLTALGERP